MSEGHQRLADVLVSAAGRDGIFHVSEAAAFGLSPSTLSRLVADGILERVGPSHLRAAHLVWTLRARQRQSLLRAGPDAALGARSALHHWEPAERPVRIELVAPRGRKRQRADIRIIQSTDLLPADYTVHRHLDTSTPVRALIDAARRLSALDLHRAVSTAVDKGLTDVAALDLRFREVARRGRPGVRRMRSCLATFGADPAATVFEQDLERLITRGGFPPPIRQYRVRADGRTYYLDHCWPEHRVWSECDSMLAHSSAEALRSDLERQNRIIGVTGFEPMRFTYFDVHERPDYVLDILGRHLPRSPTLGPPRPGGG
jgi:hypothetical protein